VNRLIYSIFSWPFAIGEFGCGSLHRNVLKVLIRPKGWIAGIVLLSRASPAIWVMGMSGSIHLRLHLPTTVGVRVGVLAGQGLLPGRRPAPARGGCATSDDHGDRPAAAGRRPTRQNKLTGVTFTGSSLSLCRPCPAPFLSALVVRPAAAARLTIRHVVKAPGPPMNEGQRRTGQEPARTGDLPGPWRRLRYRRAAGLGEPG
jgi:hypothetical protein